MKNIVYFLGAGFSVPAGLPVISNFLFKAKDQYFSNTDHYKYFKQVFAYIDGLSRAKNFTAVDLYNVEEIFSIADTHELLGKGFKKDLEQFIKDVIIYHTPIFLKSESYNSPDKVLGDSVICRRYLGFMAAILNINFEKDKDQTWAEARAVPKPLANGINYKFISLNYDNLVENSIDFFRKNYSCSLNVELAKLHGSIDSSIVPPTWNKHINRLDDAWKNAAQWLSEANEIRILGYSLPKTDMYIKHLFTTALLESKNLQKIDVICLDHDGIVESRYKEMFTFPNFRFKNFDLNDYVGSSFGYSHSVTLIDFQFNLNGLHESVFKRIS